MLTPLFYDGVAVGIVLTLAGMVVTDHLAIPLWVKNRRAAAFAKRRAVRARRPHGTG